MSKPEISSQNIPKITLKPGKSPTPVALIIKKDRSITIRGNETAKFMENFKFSHQPIKKGPILKEDIIYESRPDDFLKGNPQEKVKIFNILDKLANTSRTVARYYSISTNEILREQTSDEVVKLIGQNNYDTVFSALCSVINQESKVRGILSLLTPEQATKQNLCKRETPKCYEEKCCQTDENCMDLLFKYKDYKNKRIINRRVKLTPYVVTEDPVKPKKRLIIHPNKEKLRNSIQKGDIMESQSNSSISNIVKPVTENDESSLQISQVCSLTDLKSVLNEDSNCSIGNLSVLSNFSADNLLKNPHELLENVDCFTKSDSKIQDAAIKSEADPMEGSVNRENWYKIPLFDGSEIKVPVKPEDDFHMATPEILKCLPSEDRAKLVRHQIFVEWKCCLQKDSDGYMPIHLAVINDDVDMLQRQCFVLRNRKHSLDVVASGLTPLQMALLQDTPNCGALVAILLRHGADPLLPDSEVRSPAHMAAEAPFEALQALITHCRKQARSILESHEELWNPEYATKTDEDLSKVLLDHICNAFDGQGYTPLMVASRQGLHRNVQLLLEASPASVNTQTPNAGDTALYIAVGAACMDALDRGNRSKVVDQFKATVNALVDGCADPFLENLAGSTVHDLLSENNIPELTLLIGNKITSMKFFDGKMPVGDAYILEDIEGEVTIQDIGKKVKRGRVKGDKNRNSKANDVTKIISPKYANDNIVDTKIFSDQTTRNKPIILENIELPKIDKTKYSNIVFITNSDVKIMKPQDKLEKVSPNAKAASVTNISSASSNVTIQNQSKLDLSSDKNVKKVISSGDKKIVVLNVSHSSVVGNAKLNSDLKLVNTTKTAVKRKITQEGPCNKMQKVVLI